jgi:hypothetical protein
MNELDQDSHAVLHDKLEAEAAMDHSSSPRVVQPLKGAQVVS